MRQLSLTNIRRRASQSNLGMAFQDALDKAHHYYNTTDRARIERREREWVYTSFENAMKRPPSARAKTYDEARPRYLMMQLSDVDYSGVMQGAYISFDAKEVQGKSIPLSRFTRHQVEKLIADHKAGGVSGFMVYFTASGETFWLWPPQVQAAQDKVMFTAKGKGADPKSFSLAFLRENALLIGVFQPGQMVDWKPVLIGCSVLG